MDSRGSGNFCVREFPDIQRLENRDGAGVESAVGSGNQKRSETKMAGSGVVGSKESRTVPGKTRTPVWWQEGVRLVQTSFPYRKGLWQTVVTFDAQLLSGEAIVALSCGVIGFK
ncbi:MAG: hypothetical protein ABSA45_01835, partial [Verrucomicrobiota bacterium]